MFSELFAPVSIGVRTIAKTVRILERNQLRKVRLLKAREFDILVLLFVCSNALELHAYFVPAFLRSD